jgi:hypothetical protein
MLRVGYKAEASSKRCELLEDFSFCFAQFFLDKSQNLPKEGSIHWKLMDSHGINMFVC